MRHRDHDITVLVPLLNVLERFRDLLQGITSVDDRFELSSRDKFCDEIRSFRIFRGPAALSFLPPEVDVQRIRTMSVNLMMFRRKTPCGFSECWQRRKVVAPTMSNIRS